MVLHLNQFPKEVKARVQCLAHFIFIKTELTVFSLPTDYRFVNNDKWIPHVINICMFSLIILYYL